MQKLFTFVLLTAAFVAGDPSIPEPKDDANWLLKHESFVNNTLTNVNIPILFYGDSITAGWAGNGKEVWNTKFAPLGAVNYGIGGDRVEHVLWRIINGEVQGLNPELLVLKIGTNNGGDTARAIADGIGVILSTVRELLPNTKVLLLSVLPRTGEAQFLKISTINIYLSKFHDATNVFYLNLYDHFALDWGTVSEELFYDGLHLTAQGYQLWHDIMYTDFFDLCGCVPARKLLH